MPIRVGFWNLKDLKLDERVRSLAVGHDLDILILAEARTHRTQYATVLSRDLERPYLRVSLEGAVVDVYSRLPVDWIKPARDVFKASIYTLKTAVDPCILIVAVHMASQLRREDQDQAGACRRLAEIVAEEEAKVKHLRTLLIGDFNANPFDEALVGADSLQAVSDRRIARKGSRRVDEVEHRFFYNCMWGFLGDQGETPPGTYYYSSPKYRAFYWHAFDQVLLRPDLIDLLVPNSVQVVTKLDTLSLSNANGHPCQNVGSDHFPIVAALNLV